MSLIKKSMAEINLCCRIIIPKTTDSSTVIYYGGSSSSGGTTYTAGDGISISSGVISADFGTTSTTVACGSHEHPLYAPLLTPLFVTCACAPIFCGTSCVKAPVTCGTTCVRGGVIFGNTCVTSAVSCGTTCIVTPILKATTGIISPVIQLTTGAGNGFVLTSDEFGNGSWTPLLVGNAYSGSSSICINSNIVSAIFGTTSTTVACGSHAHGNISNLGTIGTTSGCIVCTTTSGVLTTVSPSSITVGTANNATCLNGQAASYYAVSTHSHGCINSAGCIGSFSDMILTTGTNGCIGVTQTSLISVNNATCLNGQAASYYAVSTHCHCNLYNSTNVKACTTTGGLCVCGCAWATDYVASSDCRCKKDIMPIYNAISVVDRLQGVYYKLCDDAAEKCRMGMIAQNVAKVIPEVVYAGEDGMLGIDYAKIVPVLVEAIHQLQKEITNIKTYGY